MKTIQMQDPETGEIRDEVLATVTPASAEDVALMMATPEDGPGEHDGRGEWLWMRFQNGDLCLACFPHGDTYIEISDRIEV